MESLQSWSFETTGFGEILRQKHGENWNENCHGVTRVEDCRGAGPLAASFDKGTCDTGKAQQREQSLQKGLKPRW